MTVSEWLDIHFKSYTGSKKEEDKKTCQHNLTLFSISMISQILNS